MQPINLNLIANEFWFGSYRRLFRNALTLIDVSQCFEMTCKWAIEDSNL